jgi:hypothetical protein
VYPEETQGLVIRGGTVGGEMTDEGASNDVEKYGLEVRATVVGDDIEKIGLNEGVLQIHRPSLIQRGYQR